MSEEDHLIIVKNDSKPTRFYGKFDLEFINILRKDKCYQRVCKETQENEEKNVSLIYLSMLSYNLRILS